MALIEYDVYKQKLRDLEPELEKISAALDIDSAKQEAKRLEAETEMDGFWNDLARSQKVQMRLKQLQNKISRQEKLVSAWEDLTVLCEMGQEAVVSDQGLDLEFVNDTQTPLFVTTRIYADESGSVLDVQLIGEPTDARYEIVTRATTIDAPKEPVYVRDSEGTYATYMDERVAVGTGMPGYDVVVERIAMDKNGAQLSCETISQHVYEPIAPTVYVGVQVR